MYVCSVFVVAVGVVQGGARVHTSKSGVAHLAFDNDIEAMRRVRACFVLCCYLFFLFACLFVVVLRLRS